MFRRSQVIVLALAVVVGSLGVLSAADEPVKLFNGRDLSGWRIFPENAAGAFRVEEGMIVVSGKPAGYIYTDRSYRNYVLTFDWRFARPANLTDDNQFTGNSGVLLHITGEHKVWPKSVEIQGMNRNHGQVLSVAGAPVSDAKFDAEARTRAVRRVGEWNTTEITVRNGEITTKVNGVPVSSCKTTLTEGPIGFQSEGAEIHFRNIMLRPLN